MNYRESKVLKKEEIELLEKPLNELTDKEWDKFYKVLDKLGKANDIKTE